MSMPSIELVCNKCSHSGSTMVTWGDFVYVKAGIEYPLNRQIGWCDGCQSFSAIELFEPEKLQREARAAARDLRGLLPSRGLRWISGDRKSGMDHSLGKLEALFFSLEQAGERAGTEKCLECGSQAVEALPKGVSLDYDVVSGVYEGEMKTGFVHPGCGGEFIAKPFPWRINIGYRGRRYDFDGKAVS